MTEDRQPLGVAWATWSADQPQSPMMVDVHDYAEASQAHLVEFTAFHKGTSPDHARRANATGAIGLQLWVHMAADGRRCDMETLADLRQAKDILVRMAEARCPAVGPALNAAVETWMAVIETSGDAAPGALASSDGDITVAILSGEHPEAALVGVVSNLGRSTGVWEDHGASLMACVGADRYGIRVRPSRSARTGRGKITLPNQPFSVTTRLPISALAADVETLASALIDGETRLTRALASSDSAAIRASLADGERLMARRASQERRRMAFRTARERLKTGWRRQAFVVNEDCDARIDGLADTLQELRQQMLDTQQLLLAAASWRQAQRTESLSRMAAVFLPPALVAGVLGANVLPWETPHDWKGIAGMGVLMVAGALVTMLFVSWKAVTAWCEESAIPAVAWKPALLLAVAAFGGGGLYLLLDGTSVSDAKSPANAGLLVSAPTRNRT